MGCFSDRRDISFLPSSDPFCSPGLFSAEKGQENQPASVLAGRRMVLQNRVSSPVSLLGWWRVASPALFVAKILFFWYCFSVFNARVAQLVEHSTDTRGVPGSNPGTRTRLKISRLWRFLH